MLFTSQKGYLIIIIISPKYYETVTASPVLENDERTFNTVYIHKQVCPHLGPDVQPSPPPPPTASFLSLCLTQLQIEFIQNGSKNFRFIPILFPGATKVSSPSCRPPLRLLLPGVDGDGCSPPLCVVHQGHVPSWLQNTHVYRWPRDREDILRRLMRVEKYNPPPIGPLPTIVSIPI